jgi:hypothetical protein
MLSSACSLAEQLGLPGSATDADPARSLEALELMWAVSVPGSLLELYGRYALARFQEVRTVIHDHGFEDLAVVETLIARDMDLFEGAKRRRKDLPGVPELVDDAYSGDFRDAMTTYAAKLVAAVPLVVLLAWEDGWLNGLRALEARFGGIEVPTSSRADEYVAAQHEVRERVTRIERKLDAAGALFRIEPAS